MKKPVSGATLGGASQFLFGVRIDDVARNWVLEATETCPGFLGDERAGVAVVGESLLHLLVDTEVAIGAGKFS